MEERKIEDIANDNTKDNTNEKNNIINEIKNNIIFKYQNASYDIDDDDFQFELPICRINDIDDIIVFIIIQKLNDEKYTLIIRKRGIPLLSLYDYDELLMEEQYYSIVDNVDNETDCNICGHSDLSVKNMIMQIDFQYLYKYLDTLKFCKYINKFDGVEYPIDYINKYISKLNNCCVCYELTNHKTKCNHDLCYDCHLKMFELKRNEICCPLCRSKIS